jgi:hypothetical protein
MNDAAMDQAQKNELQKTLNAFCRVFKSEDGKLVYAKLVNYRETFIVAALNEKNRDIKLSNMDMASGVDGVILMVDAALRESERREKEAKKEKTP